ncbi:MAG: hypothetical protein IJ549_07335 [Prevotella sp.]|nr:hypothetical protein [Prevotella sp.]
MKKWIYSMLIVLCGMMATMTFTACGGDDDDGGGNGSGLTGWYYSFDYNINSVKGLVSAAAKDGYESFDDSGMYYPHKGGDFGVVHAHYDFSTLYVMHIKDSQTIECYEVQYLWKPGASGTNGMDLLLQIDCPPVGTLAFYGKPAYYYVYTRNGNTISFTDNGEKAVFAITNDGLLQSGGGKWTKYNPSTVY